MSGIVVHVKYQELGAIYVLDISMMKKLKKIYSIENIITDILQVLL